MPDTYESGASLYQSDRVKVCRGHRTSDGLPVVIKQLTEIGNTAHLRQGLACEFAILQDLERRGAVHVLQPVELVQQPGYVALVSHDIGATSLRMLQGAGPLPVDELLHIASHVAAALADVHAAGIVHKDVNPGNIVFNRHSGAVQLIDFGIATTIGCEPQGLAGLLQTESTLPYISPEQTGRMNRPVDLRSDLYSLGVTLYELLCGNVPFDVNSLSRFIHAVLATPPPPLARRYPRVPPGVGAVVMQLLHKNPEQRYASARGLKADIDACLRTLRHAGTVPEFALRQADHCAEFRIPNILYGRSQPLNALTSAYQRAIQKSHLVWVCGPSGIGKSALVRELQRVATERDGWDAQFVAGKHDRLRRHIPFDALGQAIEQAVRHLLREPEAQLQRERRRMQEAVGRLGSALIDVVPALELLLGAQPEAHPLPPQAHESRITYLLRRCLRALCASRPLIVFIDDLQWADDATLRFLSRLQQDDLGGGLLFIAAYRNDEVYPTHPLQRSVDSLSDAPEPPATIAVAPLTCAAVEEMLADATHTSIPAVHALANLLLDKTGGNPFFLRTFLADLVQRQQLIYDAEQHIWTWDVPSIARSAVTDNVATLLTRRLQELPDTTHRLLSLAAVQGLHFTLSRLGATADAPRDAVLPHIQCLLTKGFIVPLTGNYRFAADDGEDVVYAFAHDRIQEAALAMLGPDTTLHAHHTLGMLLLESSQLGEGGPFAVVEHLNAAFSLITDAAVRVRLLQLNQRASEEAAAAAAHAMAAHYLYQAEALLPENPWFRAYPSMRAIQLRLASCEYILGDHQAANRRLDAALAKARTAAERAQVHQQRAECLTAMGQYVASVDSSMAALRELGAAPPAHIDRTAVMRAALRLKLALWGRPIALLPHAPDTQDPQVLAILGLLDTTALTAYFVTPLYYAWVTLTMAHLTVTHGNSPYSSFVFASLTALSASRNRLPAAKRYAAAARQRLEMDVSRNDRYRAIIAMNVSIDYARLDARQLPQSMLQASTGALECGDVNMGSNGSIVAVDALMLRSLDDCDNALQSFMRLGPMVHLEARQWYRDCRQFGRCLRGDTHGPHTFSDDAYDEAEELSCALSGSTGVVRAGKLYLYKLIACLVHRQLDEAVQAAELAYQHRITTHAAEMTVFQFAFFAALAQTQQAIAQGRRRVHNPRLLRQCRRKLERVVAVESHVFAGLPLLIRAECTAMRGARARAALLYERATEDLDRSGYALLAALGHECAATYFQRAVMRTAASAHLRLAYQTYGDWGATYKLAHLDQDVRTSTPSIRDLHATRDDLARSIDLPTLMQVTQTLGSEVVLDKLALKIVQHTLAVAGATRAVLLQRQGSTWAIQVDSMGGVNEVPDSLINYVARANEPLLLADAAHTADFQRDSYVTRFQPRSLLCAPLLHQNQLRGVLYLENVLAPGLFTPDRLELVKLIAAQAAIALENARLYANLEHQVAARTQQLRQVHARVLQLQRDAAESQMAGGFAHEMRNALAAPTYALSSLEPQGAQNTLAGRLRQIADKLAPPDAAELRDHAERLELSVECATQGLERAMLLTEQILNYADMGNLVPGSDDVSLAALCEAILEEVSARLSTANVEVQLEIPSDLQFHAHPDHIGTLLRHLIHNACDALEASQQAHRHLTVQAHATAGAVHLSVADTGVGIAAQLHPLLFQPFYTTKGSSGAGLGLGLCRKIAQAYGGEISFESSAGHGSVFRVSFPDALDAAAPLRPAPAESGLLAGTGYVQ